MVALDGDDCSSRRTICSGFWLYGAMMKLPAFMMSVMSDCAIVVSARATRSAVELAIWVTRRSTMIAWLSSTAPMNITPMIGAIKANSTAAMPRASAFQRRSSAPARAPRSLSERAGMAALGLVQVAIGALLHGRVHGRQL